MNETDESTTRRAFRLNLAAFGRAPDGATDRQHIDHAAESLRIADLASAKQLVAALRHRGVVPSR